MFKNILYPVDIDQEASVAALDEAGKIARKFGARLTLLNVQTPIPSMVATYLPEGFPAETDRAVAERMKGEIDKHKLGAGTEVVVRHGAPHHMILEYAEENGVDLIVIASHHPGLADYLLGSTAGQVVRHAQCSVLVLRT